jgi:type IV pilus biogenesis protein CpaD/CtpE
MGCAKLGVAKTAGLMAVMARNPRHLLRRSNRTPSDAVRAAAQHGVGAAYAASDLG